METKRYQKQKEIVRQKAIDWQANFDNNQSIGWGELAEQQRKMEKLGKRYGLLKEFKENGII